MKRQSRLPVQSLRHASATPPPDPKPIDASFRGLAVGARRARRRGGGRRHSALRNLSWQGTWIGFSPQSIGGRFPGRKRRIRASRGRPAPERADILTDRQARWKLSATSTKRTGSRSSQSACAREARRKASPRSPAEASNGYEARQGPVRQEERRGLRGLQGQQVARRTRVGVGRRRGHCPFFVLRSFSFFVRPRVRDALPAARPVSER